MFQGYSLNVTAVANAAFPINNVTIQKGSTAKLGGVGTI